MIRHDEVVVGVALRFITPDGSPDIAGLVQRVEGGYAYLGGQRWPVDVVARESTIIPQPTPQHRWDGALDKWYLPEEKQTHGGLGVVMSHARHA